MFFVGCLQIICLILRYLNKNKPQTSFKKRYKDSYQVSDLNSGYKNYHRYYLFFAKNTRIEFIYFFRFKKIFKKIIKKNKNNLWFFVNKNYPVSKKSKNSRMGKGKGLFNRMCGRFRAGFGFLYLQVINNVLIYITKIRLFFKQNFNIVLGFLKTNPTLLALSKQKSVKKYSLRHF
jgi:ribosomal protein L16/L10AE